jgi:hypothetical protein
LGCGAVKEKQVVTTPPAYAAARSATTEEIVQLINDRYADIRSVTVSRVEVEFVGGSVEEGYLEKYRKAKGILVAEEPDSIFINILNPLTSSSVLVMASSRRTFQIWVPSKNQFVIGTTEREISEENPIYNVRPAHILNGVLIEPVPESHPEYKFSLEEDEDGVFKYYVLGVFEVDEASPLLRLRRRIWIERSRFQIARQQYYRGMSVISIIDYGKSVELGGKLFPTSVMIERPAERYSIRLDIDPENVELNRKLNPEAFMLHQPSGAEIIRVSDQTTEYFRNASTYRG